MRIYKIAIMLVVFCLAGIAQTMPSVTGAPVRASQLGAVMDCNPLLGIKVGGGNCTDNTTILNNYLATASVTNPIHLVLDGGTIISSALTISGNGYTIIDGVGSNAGVFVKAASNANAIVTAVGSGRGQNITIRNITVNGNVGTITSAVYQNNGNSSNASRYQGPGAGGCLMNIIITTADYVYLNNINSINSPCWNTKITNATHVWVNNYATNAPTGTGVAAGSNWDAIHLAGGCSYIFVNGAVSENSLDDAFTIDSGNQSDINAAVSHVFWSNSTATNATSVIRLYANCGPVTAKIDDINYANITGTASASAVILGFNGSGGSGPCIYRGATDSVSSINFVGVRVAAPQFIQSQNESVGEMDCVNCEWRPTVFGSAIGFVLGTGTPGARFGDLSLSNFTIYRDQGNSGYLALVPVNAGIVRFNVEGFRMADPLGSGIGNVGQAIDVPAGGGFITRLWVGSADLSNFTNPYGANGDALITKVQGPGVTTACGASAVCMAIK